MDRRGWARLVCAGALSLAAVVALAPPAVAAEPATELADRYAPVVRIVAQTEPCGHGEPYEPTDVNVVLDNPDVALRGPWAGGSIVKIGPSGTDLAKGLTGYHLDFPGDALNPGCDYEKWSDTITAGTHPTTYAYVVADPAYPGKLALQYWFFYAFNDFNDKHEGDWEMIQLDFDAATPEAALRTTPNEAGYSQHTERRARPGRLEAPDRRRHAPGRLRGARLACQLLLVGALPRPQRRAGRRLRRHRRPLAGLRPAVDLFPPVRRRT